ncbi:hypothetical protein [Burkholderia sp. BCC1988]|uniref:hypothetical protein n=1 Tax=Burkholderia sp. BCC1988 TaxID=2817443 RepID=UPI002AB23B1F|nr:hypothetical protein [Burkholderia sp. BCC1988]
MHEQTRLVSDVQEGDAGRDRLNRVYAAILGARLSGKRDPQQVLGEDIKLLVAHSDGILEVYAPGYDTFANYHDTVYWAWTKIGGGRSMNFHCSGFTAHTDGDALWFGAHQGSRVYIAPLFRSPPSDGHGASQMC